MAAEALNRVQHKYPNFVLFGGLLRKKSSKDVDIYVKDTPTKKQIKEFLFDFKKELVHLQQPYIECDHLTGKEYERCILRASPRVDVFVDNDLCCKWFSKRQLGRDVPKSEKTYCITGYDIFSAGEKAGVYSRGFIKSDHFDLVVDTKVLEEKMNKLAQELETIDWETDKIRYQAVLSQINQVDNALGLYRNRVFPILGIKQKEIEYEDYVGEIRKEVGSRTVQKVMGVKSKYMKEW